VTHPHANDVAPAHSNVLVPLDRQDIVRSHVVARLQPRHSTRARHVKENTAADDAVARDVDGQLGGAVLGHGVRR
jgi:hypothetical protein